MVCVSVLGKKESKVEENNMQSFPLAFDKHLLCVRVEGLGTAEKKDEDSSHPWGIYIVVNETCMTNKPNTLWQSNNRTYSKEKKPLEKKNYVEL